ncbi:MAG: hypothetical protein RIR25_734 [Verrucomicrobiota bacterium]|jgi:hypothetical protein
MRQFPAVAVIATQAAILASLYRLADAVGDGAAPAVARNVDLAAACLRDALLALSDLAFEAPPERPAGCPVPPPIRPETWR